MDIRRHPGKSRHGLTLASGRNQYRLFWRIVLQFVNLDKRVLRNIQVAKLRRGGDDIDHAPSFHDYLSAVLIGRIDNLLHPIHIRRKGGYDNSRIAVLRKQVVKGSSHRTLRLGKPCTLRVRTVRHQGKHTFLSDLRKPLQIDGIPEDRSIIHLKVSCVYDDSRRGIDRKGRCVLNTMVCFNKLNAEFSKINRLSVPYDFALRTSHQIVFS